MGIPEPFAKQYWSHQPITDEVRAELEKILAEDESPTKKGGDAPCQATTSSPAGNAAPSVQPVRRGEIIEKFQSHVHKLLAHQVEEIRILSKTKSNREIAKQFNVAPSTVDRIISGESWTSAGAAWIHPSFLPGSFIPWANQKETIAEIDRRLLEQIKTPFCTGPKRTKIVRDCIKKIIGVTRRA